MSFATKEACEHRHRAKENMELIGDMIISFASVVAYRKKLYEERAMESNEELITIEMQNEDGKNVSIELTAKIEDEENGKIYIMGDDLENKEKSYLFEVIPTGEAFELRNIEDAKEFSRVFDLFEKVMQEER